MLFEEQPFDKLIDNPQKEYNNSGSIYKMHHFQVETFWSVWIFFPEEVHNTNIKNF